MAIASSCLDAAFHKSSIIPLPEKRPAHQARLGPGSPAGVAADPFGIEAPLERAQPLVGPRCERLGRSVLLIVTQEVQVDARALWSQGGDEAFRPGGLLLGDRLVRLPDRVDVELVDHVAARV